MIYDIADIWSASDGWPVKRLKLAARDGGGAEKGALLFLGGRGDHMQKYSETLEYWAETGWAVESFDWRGQGGSGRFGKDRLTGHIDDFSCWLDDLEAYCRDWLARTAGPHVIVSHSMGGHILLRALVERRVNIDAAVLVAPMIGIRASGLPGMVARAIAGAVCAAGYSCWPLWPSRLYGPGVERHMRRALTHSERRITQEIAFRRKHGDLIVDAPSWGWLKAAYRSIGLLEHAGGIEKVTAPVLILATHGDRLVSMSAIMGVARRLPDARIHCYGRSVAHEILREVDHVRDDALDRIDSFFDEVTAARRSRDGTAK